MLSSYSHASKIASALSYYVMFISVGQSLVLPKLNTVVAHASVVRVLLYISLIMWKIIVLVALLTLIDAKGIKSIYGGDWMLVAVYPTSTNDPVCIRFSFTKSPVSVNCVYEDGRKANSVQVTMMAETGELLERYSMPMMVVDTPAEVMPVLNAGCKSGDVEVSDHAVVRLVNDNYFIMYHYVPPPEGTIHSDTNQNAAYLFSKILVPEAKLFELMTMIEDLKDREGSVMCAVENYNGPQ